MTDPSDDDYTYADAGGTMVKMGRQDAAVIWRAERGGFELCMPKVEHMGGPDAEIPQEVAALAEVLLRLSDDVECTAMAVAFSLRQRS